MEAIADLLQKRINKQRQEEMQTQREDIKSKIAEGGSYFYKYLRNDYRQGALTIMDPATDKPTTYLPRIHELFKKLGKAFSTDTKGHRQTTENSKRNIVNITPTEKALLQAHLSGNICTTGRKRSNPKQRQEWMDGDQQN